MESENSTREQSEDGVKCAKRRPRSYISESVPPSVRRATAAVVMELEGIVMGNKSALDRANSGNSFSNSNFWPMPSQIPKHSDLRPPPLSPKPKNLKPKIPPPPVPVQTSASPNRAESTASTVITFGPSVAQEKTSTTGPPFGEHGIPAERVCNTDPSQERRVLQRSVEPRIPPPPVPVQTSASPNRAESTTSTVITFRPSLAQEGTSGTGRPFGEQGITAERVCDTDPSQEQRILQIDFQPYQSRPTTPRSQELNGHPGYLPPTALNTIIRNLSETVDLGYNEDMRRPRSPATTTPPNRPVDNQPLRGVANPCVRLQCCSVADAGPDSAAIAELLLVPWSASLFASGSLVRVDYLNHQRFGVIRSIDVVLDATCDHGLETATVEIEGNESLPEGWPIALERLCDQDGNLFLSSSGNVALVPLSFLSKDERLLLPSSSDHVSTVMTTQAAMCLDERMSTQGGTLGEQMKQAGEMGYTYDEFMEALCSDYRNGACGQFSSIDEMIDTLCYVQATHTATSFGIQDAAEGGLGLQAQEVPLESQESIDRSSEMRRMSELLEETRKKLDQAQLELNKVPTCAICLDKRPEIVFAPCSHFVCCKDCGSRLDCCPICRKMIRHKTTVFQ